MIGEAAKSLPENGWHEGQTRSRFGISISIVWETVKNDLPVLKRQVELLLKELENASLLICTTKN